MLEIAGFVGTAVAFFLFGLFFGRKHAAAVNTVATAAEAATKAVN
jgi:hypothetical protein